MDKPTYIQIPDDVKRLAKARATMEGLTFKTWLTRIIEKQVQAQPAEALGCALQADSPSDALDVPSLSEAISHLDRAKALLERGSQRQDSGGAKAAKRGRKAG